MQMKCYLWEYRALIFFMSAFERLQKNISGKERIQYFRSSDGATVTQQLDKMLQDVIVDSKTIKELEMARNLVSQPVD